jgi:hypothetical protein
VTGGAVGGCARLDLQVVLRGFEQLQPALM